MDQQRLAALLSQPVSHAELYRARDEALPEQQAMLAPLEHEAFAREWVKENPWLAVPSLSVAIPAYSAAKALGLIQSRSPASMEELFAGYRGMMQGITER